MEINAQVVAGYNVGSAGFADNSPVVTVIQSLVHDLNDILSQILPGRRI